ncbi:MAG: hypothetical protein RL885_28785 [Planctomycetota bacterium]
MLTTPRLIVTIDTEADMPGWRPKGEVTLENLRYLPKLQDLFESYGVPPTYLITYPVARSREATEYLRELQERGGCEIGAHLHPWTTPPLENGEALDNRHPHHLPPDRQREKLRVLTDAIAQALGERPIHDVG